MCEHPPNSYCYCTHTSPPTAAGDEALQITFVCQRIKTFSYWSAVLFFLPSSKWETLLLRWKLVWEILKGRWVLSTESVWFGQNLLYLWISIFGGGGATREAYEFFSCQVYFRSAKNRTLPDRSHSFNIGCPLACWLTLAASCRIIAMSEALLLCAAEAGRREKNAVRKIQFV